MGANHGQTNEYEIIQLLNGRTISETKSHFRVWLSNLFSQQHEMMSVKKLNNEQKADIQIQIGNQKRFISIKSGDHNTFHTEAIESFIPYLRSIGVSENTLKTIVFYHYGDMTLDGTGPTRFTSKELRSKYGKAFKLASDELSHPSIMKSIIQRCVIQGKG